MKIKSLIGAFIAVTLGLILGTIVIIVDPFAIWPSVLLSATVAGIISIAAQRNLIIATLVAALAGGGVLLFHLTVLTRPAEPRTYVSLLASLIN